MLLSQIFRRLIRPFYWFEKMLFYYGLRNKKELILPDFLCIGVQKSGTSWLHENLSRHPEIFMPEKKEIDFFSNNYRFLGFSLAWYANFFKPGMNKIKGEATPYCDMPLHRIRYIKKIMPNIKLIIILRNPIDRIWSSGLMHLVRALKRNFYDISETEFKKFLSKEEILKQGLYTDILNKWRSVFSSSQLLVCFYDDLLKSPQQFYSSILQFIGASEINYSCSEEYVNKSPTFKMPETLKTHFSTIYKASIIDLSKEFGDKPMAWLRGDSFQEEV